MSHGTKRNSRSFPASGPWPGQILLKGPGQPICPGEAYRHTGVGTYHLKAQTLASREKAKRSGRTFPRPGCPLHPPELSTLGRPPLTRAWLRGRRWAPV